jgi:hypothetical protein
MVEKSHFTRFYPGFSILHWFILTTKRSAYDLLNSNFWSFSRVTESNSEGIYSLHRGGANVTIADGSLKFLSDFTNFATLVSLFGRSDGSLPE